MNLSPRLQKLLDYLQGCGFIGATTLEIQKACMTCAPGSDAADLRKNGIGVACSYDGRSRDNRKIFRYRLEVLA